MYSKIDNAETKKYQWRITEQSHVAGMNTKGQNKSHLSNFAHMFNTLTQRMQCKLWISLFGK